MARYIQKSAFRADVARVTRSLLAISCLCVAPADAFAYVDPGSGLLLIQGLLAFIGGVIVFVKNPVATFRRWWERCIASVKNRDR